MPTGIIQTFIVANKIKIQINVHLSSQILSFKLKTFPWKKKELKLWVSPFESLEFFVFIHSLGFWISWYYFLCIFVFELILIFRVHDGTINFLFFYFHDSSTLANDIIHWGCPNLSCHFEYKLMWKCELYWEGPIFAQGYFHKRKGLWLKLNLTSCNG